MLVTQSVQGDADTDIWQVYSGHICVVMYRDCFKNTDALVHDSVLSDT